MEDNFKKRLREMNNDKFPQISKRLLQGGMQERLFRREVIRYGEEKKKKNTKTLDNFKVCFADERASIIEPEEEPIFRRIRSRGGFY